MFFSGISLLCSFEWNGTRWYSLAGGNGMEALLVVELTAGGICRTTHAYLRAGEEIPFEAETVTEEWYFDGRDRLFIMDSWGEFASFLWDEESARLVTSIGGEEIVLTPLTDRRWSELKDRFSLESGQ